MIKSLATAFVLSAANSTASPLISNFWPIKDTNSNYCPIKDPQAPAAPVSSFPNYQSPGYSSLTGLGTISTPYYGIQWSLIVKYYYRNENYDLKINESLSNSFTNQNVDRYTILKLSDNPAETSFCVSPGCATYIWSKMKVCLQPGGLPTKIFIRVLKDGLLDRSKAKCDTTPIQSTNCYYCVLDYVDANTGVEGILYQIGVYLDLYSSSSDSVMNIDAIYFYTNIYK